MTIFRIFGRCCPGSFFWIRLAAVKHVAAEIRCQCAHGSVDMNDSTLHTDPRLASLDRLSGEIITGADICNSKMALCRLSRVIG